MSDTRPPDSNDEGIPDDAVDDAIRRQLRNTVAAVPAAAEDLRTLRPRFVQARRRRQAATTALSSAAAIVVIAVGLTLTGSGDVEVLTPATGNGSSTTTSSTTTTSQPPETSTSIPAAGVTSPTTPSTSVPRAPGGSSPTATVARPPTSTTATTPPAPVERPLTVAGGTVVIRSDATSVTIVSVTPATGWQVADRKTDLARIEVRFEQVDGSGQSRVEARVEDGQLRTVLS